MNWSMYLMDGNWPSCAHEQGPLVVEETNLACEAIETASDYHFIELLGPAGETSAGLTDPDFVQQNRSLGGVSFADFGEMGILFVDNGGHFVAFEVCLATDPDRGQSRVRRPFICELTRSAPLYQPPRESREPCGKD